MPINRENLLLLAEHLEKLPADYGHFDMTDFVLGADGDYVDIAEEPANITAKLINSRGTCACAIGHAPTIRGLEARKDEGWDDYSLRVFGLSRDSKSWNFLFSSDWHGWGDPHPSIHAAAKRLRYLAKHGRVTHQFFEGYLDA